MESLQTVAMSIIPLCISDLTFVLRFILYLNVLMSQHGIDFLAMGMLHDPFTFHVVFLLSLLPVLTFVMWLINTCLIWKALFFYIPKVSGCLESVIAFPFVSLIECLMFVFGVFQVLSENNSHTRPGRLHSDQKLTTGIGKLSLFTVKKKKDQKLDVDLEVVGYLSIVNITTLSVSFVIKGIHCYLFLLA